MVQDKQDKLFQAVFDHAVRLLSNRLHTKHELSRKLRLRKYDAKLIEQVLERLTELRVLNDEQFAEVFFQNLIRYKTFGYYGLQMKLKSRGIADALISRLLGEFGIADEIEIGRRVIAKKKGDTEKIIRTLKTKGFRTETIYRLIEESREE